MAEKTKKVTVSLTSDEENKLIKISKNFFGNSNKSGMIRYWINKFSVNKKDIN